MSSSGEVVKSLSVILVEINEHTDEAQLEKLRFLARGLFRTVHVGDADSVPSLHRTMVQHQDTSKRAVFYLHYMLEKASVKPACTNQLSSYVEEVQAHGKPPMFYFHEMLFDVAESFNQQQFKSFRNIVEDELKANVNNFENALRVFQRLIDLGTLTMAEESLDQLKQWLVDSGMGSTAEEVVQRYKDSLEARSSNDSGSTSETTRLLEGGGRLNPSFFRGVPQGGRTASQGWRNCLSNGRSLKWFVGGCCLLAVVVMLAVVLVPLYYNGTVSALPSNQEVTLYYNKTVLAFGECFEAFRRKEVSLTVTKGMDLDDVEVTACSLTQHDKDLHLQTREVNYTHNLMSYAEDVRKIAKLGGAADPIDQFDYILHGALEYSLELIDNASRIEQVSLTFFDDPNTCEAYVRGDPSEPSMNGVLCTVTKVSPVVTYTCHFSLPAYRCAVWTVPPNTNFTYSTAGHIQRYSIGGPSKHCNTFGATKIDSETTLSLNPSFWAQRKICILVTLSNIGNLFSSVTVEGKLQSINYATWVSVSLVVLVFVPVAIVLIVLLIIVCLKCCSVPGTSCIPGVL